MEQFIGGVTAEIQRLTAERDALRKVVDALEMWAEAPGGKVAGDYWEEVKQALTDLDALGGGNCE